MNTILGGVSSSNRFAIDAANCFHSLTISSFSPVRRVYVHRVDASLTCVYPNLRLDYDLFGQASSELSSSKQLKNKETKMKPSLFVKIIQAFLYWKMAQGQRQIDV